MKYPLLFCYWMIINLYIFSLNPVSPIIKISNKLTIYCPKNFPILRCIRMIEFRLIDKLQFVEIKKLSNAPNLLVWESSLSHPMLQCFHTRLKNSACPTAPFAAALLWATPFLLDRFTLCAHLCAT